MGLTLKRFDVLSVWAPVRQTPRTQPASLASACFTCVTKESVHAMAPRHTEASARFPGCRVTGKPHLFQGHLSEHTVDAVDKLPPESLTNPDQTGCCPSLIAGGLEVLASELSSCVCQPQQPLISIDVSWSGVCCLT